MTQSFVPVEFDVPMRLETDWFYLEPLGPQHNEQDHAAWMSSLSHIHNTPGFPRGESQWPYEMPLEDNQKDLIGHANDFVQRQGFTYTVIKNLSVIGCVYIYPSQDQNYDAHVASWVTASMSELDQVLWQQVTEWLGSDWPFQQVDYAARVMLA